VTPSGGDDRIGPHQPDFGRSSVLDMKHSGAARFDGSAAMTGSAPTSRISGARRFWT
jgi:hypothetical protein